MNKYISFSLKKVLLEYLFKNRTKLCIFFCICALFCIFLLIIFCLMSLFLCNQLIIRLIWMAADVKPLWRGAKHRGPGDAMPDAWRLPVRAVKSLLCTSPKMPPTKKC